MGNRRKEPPRTVEVRRSDPVYMAHAYLTKVPVPAIEPFILAHTDPGDIVLDPFAGSGMTGVAAAVLGRRARLSDISVLGQHIGRNYLNLVDGEELRRHATKAIEQVYGRLGPAYDARCSRCGETGVLAKTIWSVVVACGDCSREINFYRSLEAAGWHKAAMKCNGCGRSISSRSRRVHEGPVIDYIMCECSRSQVEQDWTPPLGTPDLTALDYPDLPIEPARQMYVASALGRHGLTSTATFFSPRNLGVLAMLREEIARVDDSGLASKLLFAFTGILTRSSKRYQWSKQRPLNAANGNYYVAPIFYEWNVLDLFGRKVEALISADRWIENQRGTGMLFGQDPIDVSYELASATQLPLPDDSVDYVFTDPPFGSNIFYADMNLFHEAWLGSTTAEDEEAVVDRSRTSPRFRDADRYERMLTEALRECRRVLKPEGRLSMVFGNSSGKVWSLVQRAIAAAGFEIEPELIATLDKGQRSVKGLASGFEHVATLDLILTMRPTAESSAPTVSPTPDEVRAHVVSLAESESVATPSHLYVELLRHGFARNWQVGGIHLRDVTAALIAVGFDVDGKSGRLVRDGNTLHQLR